MGGALIKGWAKAARKNEMPEGLEITVTAKTQKTLDKMSEEFPELHTTYHVSIGHQVLITPTVSPSNATDPQLTFTSSDPSVATVERIRHS